MILLKRGESMDAVVTAGEKTRLDPTVFTLSFTNDITKDLVTISPAVDISTHSDRYNMFSVDPALFDELDNGFYTYRVADQEGNLLEIGKMKLVGERSVPVQYQNTPTNYKTYGE